MTKFIKILCLIFTVVIGSVGMSAQADYQKGADAYGKKDYATAIEQWTIVAEQGDAVAQFNLGTMYYRGIGTPKNLKMAANWYNLAAAQGYAKAQHSLGILYENGTGVPKDAKSAIKWYKLAAKQGNADAPHNLGVM